LRAEQEEAQEEESQTEPQPEGSTVRRAVLATALTLAVAALLPAHAGAVFGLNSFDVTFTDENGSSVTQAGAHPFALNTSFGINHHGKGAEAIADGKIRDAFFEQVTGFTGDTTAVPICSTADFLADECSPASVVGAQAASIINADFFHPPGPAYYLQPPPGAPVRIGWQVEDVPIMVDIVIKPAPPHNASAGTRGINQTVSVFSAIAQFWGVPADPAHDTLRGSCAGAGTVLAGMIVPPLGGKACPAGTTPKAFLTLPRACSGPLETHYEVFSWEGDFDEGGVLTHDDAIPPNPQGFTGCGKLAFSPEIGSQASADSAETSSGLDFTIDFNDEGLKNPEGLAGSEIEETRVILPKGVTANPSVAEGLGVCTPADLERETLAAAPGEGCPNSSKIGTVSVQTPLLEEAVGGSVFLAQQDDPATTEPGRENPFDSLIAFYIVLRNAQNGILVKQPAKVEPDPRTGQLITTVQEIPQLPFSHFQFHFSEGQRAPLITPPACGTYTTEAEFIPWARPEETVRRSATFQITRGVGGGPCPPGGVPPFNPGFEAGSLNNSAGAYSPFYMRLTRHDGEQDMTKFSSTLPPGVTGKLAGISKCPDAQIAAAAAKTGRQELASPSCPPGSQIGRTLAGAGVGSTLVYVPGQLYLAGPYKGAPLSVAAITPAVAGPFDAGTVAVRVGLSLNPDTAEVTADGSASDPIPHILKGIPLKLRDLRVYADRPNFTLNPTSCDPASAKATLFGSYLDIFSPADDVPVSLASPYQAASCMSLGFAPKLSLKLKGGTKRGGHPSLKAVFTAKEGDANTAEAVATLPRSAFLDQAHIRTICTRVQFAAKACPKGSQYGSARVFTPLLEEPLEGPAYLRSSNHKLPDLVLALHGIVDVNAVARIDSYRGGIRSSFETLPDAPVSKAIITMQGGSKGLIINSRNLCAKPSKASVELTGQNGKLHDFGAPVKASCSGKGASARRR
jgi:hypothetical protein